ncbi:hypothetical protein [Alkalihalobacillus sp. BA299]|uniref:hypothetical protein n=1 Tax=Alkalihalobacillus sp. BA299 TaxID=2815938 RepID=UPI001ADC6EBE|nr:hypothetical protein [Alkalihalobacillus sp. BA299]
MNNSINGFHDFYTILSNERKIGGGIEAETIKLRTGEVFRNPVFTNIDYSGSVFYTIGFMTEDGVCMIVHVNDISSITSPVHKKVAMIRNKYYRAMKVKEKVKYLKRLFKADQGAYTKPFLEEAKLIIEDVGVKPIENDQEIGQELIFKISNKVNKIA